MALAGCAMRSVLRRSSVGMPMKTLAPLSLLSPSRMRATTMVPRAQSARWHAQDAHQLNPTPLGVKLSAEQPVNHQFLGRPLGHFMFSLFGFKRYYSGIFFQRVVRGHLRFHRHSTRYSRTSREVLDALDKDWMEQPHYEP